ncbi:MAG: sugar ABC transporter substrate-binding protein [Gammaproteobacteria bacterium]|nr:sugar ABC transporter substrate-binding protein [Gammaproteobacteria bacterium]
MNHEVPTLRIGVLYWSINIPGQVAMAQGLQSEAERINVEAKKRGLPAVELITRVAGDGPNGIENQINQMYELIQLKPDAIIVQPTDNAALADPLRMANRQGIPVIAYDQYISGGKLAAYITSNNHQAGYLGGEYIAAQFPDDQILQMVLVEYPLVSSTVERLDGFLDGLRDQGQPYTILKSYQAVEPVGGQRAGHAILRDFPDKGSVDVVFTVNDGGGLSVVDVLAEAGRDEIVVATVDGDPQSIENIRSRRITVIDSAQFCGPLGAEAMLTAYAVAQKESVPSHILIPVFPITTKTLNDYPGWKGPIPDSFTKLWPSKAPLWKNTTSVVR